MKWKEWFSKRAADLRFAASRRIYTCDGCGKEIFDGPETRLCADCAAEIPRSLPACPKCGRKGLSQGLCLDCKRTPPRFVRGFSPFSYRGLAARMLNRFKNGERHLAWFFGGEMAAILENATGRGEMTVLEEGILIASVPASEERKRARGYDQAAELAEVLSRLTGAERKQVLTMTRRTQPQKSLTAEARRKNAEGAYRAIKGSCAGRTVLLVDDLMTTGATADACTRALYKAGAAAVYFLSAAAVPERAVFFGAD